MEFSRQPKKTFVLLFTSLALTLSPTTFAKHKAKAKETTKEVEKKYSVDPQQSVVKWVGKKVTGAHDGTIMVKNGSVDFSQGTLKGGQLTIDMTSIKVDDLKDKEYNDKLVNHLKDEDFFAAGKFPESSITLTKITKTDKVNEYKADGTMTIKGMAKPVSMVLNATENGGAATVDGTVKIDRTQWDIRYGSGKFFDNLGDKMIHDEFEISFNLHGK